MSRFYGSLCICLFEGGVGVASLWRHFGRGSEICDEVWQRGRGINFTPKLRDVIYGRLVRPTANIRFNEHSNLSIFPLLSFRQCSTLKASVLAYYIQGRFTVRPHCSQCRALHQLEGFRLSVCMSVRPSVTFRYCVQKNEDTIVRFSESGRTNPLVSGELKFIRIFAGDHPQRGR